MLEPGVFLYASVTMEKKNFIQESIFIEKSTIVYLFTLIIVVMFSIFSYIYFSHGDFVYASILVVLLIGGIINFLYFWRTKNAINALYFFAFAGLPIFIPWQINGGIYGTGIYWMYINMVGLFFMLGSTRGIVYVFGLLFVSVTEFLFQQLGYIPSYYSVTSMTTFYFGYIIMIAILYGYQLSKDKAWVNLEVSNARNDAILESVDDGMVAIDTKGKVIFANEPVHILLGWRRSELLGKSWVNIVTLQDPKGKPVPTAERPFTLALKQGDKIHTSYQYSYVRKDKSVLPVSITISPIISGDKIIGAIEVFRDVTKEREIDRMKTEFISLASHQLRTPLSAIKWNLEMLLAGDTGKLSKDQFDMAKNVDESNERMISLVNSLLNVSRIESGRIIIEPQMTKLGELVEGVIQELKQKIHEKKQKLIVSFDTNMPEINIDSQLIRQVYVNLLTNAIKYTPEEGEITIIISDKENEIISQISDTGYGIPEEDKNKLFQKFYRGDNVTKIVTDGNGLGMYLVKAIITSSEGKIWFESHTSDEKGIAKGQTRLPAGRQGTTFWFSLPKSGMTAQKGEVTLDG